MHVYMCIYIYIHTYICIYIYIYIHMYVTVLGGALNALKSQCAQRDSLSELLL